MSSAATRSTEVAIESKQGFDYSLLNPETTELLQRTANRIRERGTATIIAIGTELIEIKARLKAELDRGHFGQTENPPLTSCRNAHDRVPLWPGLHSCRAGANRDDGCGAAFAEFVCGPLQQFCRLRVGRRL